VIEQRTPRGLNVSVPESPSEDPSPKFPPEEAGNIAGYYRENGYVIVRGLVAAAACEHIRGLWSREIKPSREFIYRQATAKAERHSNNAQGWVMNPILNLQSVDPRRYPAFRAFATEHILTAPGLAGAFRTLLGEQPKVVQSMYFEGNSATWEHQDSYYLDSEHIGAMAAAWIALEDIAATAGRFFICPGSHRIDLGRQTSANNIADNHEVYIRSVVKKIEELGLPIRAPFLEKGDVLFWNAWTIHGSLNSQDPRHSRSSITCHAIPDSHRFLQLQSRVMTLNPARVNGVAVHRPKDLGLLRNRVMFHFETHYPEMFYRLKKAGVRMQVRLKAAQQG
jgi:phytanoyl-CoA hydroxylase